jgi:hypothetical protein
MRPTLGRIVIYSIGGACDPCYATSNGAKELPAIIVRVWSDNCVNLKVMTDAVHDQWVTSCGYAETPVEGCASWNWPARIL